MRIGVDFDNTIVCYDRLFARVARERALVPADLPATKQAVRDWLRAAGREDTWTELQGLVYGPRLVEAEPYPGVTAFFAACRRAGREVVIISHKTRRPYRGPAFDLHAAALDWLAVRGFWEPPIALPRERVWLEPTLADKLARIGTVGCTHFIDDLPEFLAEPGLPAGVARLLFDPAGIHSAAPGVTIVRSWTEVGERLLGGAA